MPRRPRRRAGAGAAALALAALLAGCGSDGEGNATDAQEPPAETAPIATATATGTAAPVAAAPNARKLIAAAIQAALASSDPEKACDEAVTTGYVELTYGDRAGCEAAVGAGGTAESVRITGITPGGDSATAVAMPSGGPSDGERLEVALLRQGEQWKVDSLRSNLPVGP